MSESLGGKAGVGPEGLAEAVAELALDKKADEVTIVDVRRLVDYTDFLVLCTGRSDRQVKAIHEEVKSGVADRFGLRAERVEGLPESRWILGDYGDVVLHVFTPDARDFYALDELWGDAPVRAVGE